MRCRAVVLSFVAAAVLIAGFGQLLLGPSRTGLTIDEPAQVMRTDNWLKGGGYVPEMLEQNTSTAGSKYVYGPAFSGLAHGFNVIAGDEPWRTATLADAPTVNRHLTSALFALLAALAAGLATATITGSRLVGFWTAAALLAIPIWTGMGFFNPKDTPVAAGFTFFTVALILALRGRSGRRPGGRDFAVGGMAAAGLFFAVGTRLAMWLPLALSLIVFLGLTLLSRRSGGERGNWPALLTGALIGLGAVIAVYPSVFADPFEFVSRTLGDSSGYEWQGVTLTAGRLLPSQPPWWYLPAWAFASIPLLIGILAVGGFLGPARDLTRRLRQRTPLGPIGPREAATILVLAQLLVLPVGSMVMGSTMYAGLRQHLYMVPAVAMLAGIGASYLLGWTRSAASGSVHSWLVTGGLALALVVPMAEQLMLFPYSYIYVNPVAGIGGVNDRWEGDYWWASLREASDHVPAGKTAYCIRDYDDRFDARRLTPCPSLLRPYAIEQQPGRADEPGRRWTLLARQAGESLPPKCTPAANVTRWLRGETVVISFVARCR